MGALLFLILLATAALVIWSRRSSARPGQIGQRLADRSSAAASQPDDPAQASKDFASIEIQGQRIFGPVARSPNDRFQLICQDFDYRGGRHGGARSKGNGRVVLIDEGRVRYTTDLQRPNDGVVVDSGVAAVNDWLFSDALSGTFHVLSPEGEILISETVAANLLACGLSPDGRFAWFTTAHAPSKDNAVLVVYSVLDRVRVGCFERPYFWGVNSIEVTADTVTVHSENNVTYRYAGAGELINAEEVQSAIEAALVQRGSPWDLLSVVESRLSRNEKGSQDSLDAPTLLHLIERALAQTPDPKTLARAHRRKGEILERMGNPSEAIESLREAVRLDEKVGAKRLLQKLEREFGGER